MLKLIFTFHLELKLCKKWEEILMVQSLCKIKRKPALVSCRLTYLDTVEKHCRTCDTIDEFFGVSDSDRKPEASFLVFLTLTGNQSRVFCCFRLWLETRGKCFGVSDSDRKTEASFFGVSDTDRKPEASFFCFWLWPANGGEFFGDTILEFT